MVFLGALKPYVPGSILGELNLKILYLKLIKVSVCVSKLIKYPHLRITKY